MAARGWIKQTFTH